MMKFSRLEKNKKIEDNIIKDVRDPFRLKKEIDDTTIKDIINLFSLKKENEVIKEDRVKRDIRNLFEHEEEDYYKPVRAGNFWSKSFIEYDESNDDRNKSKK